MPWNKKRLNAAKLYLILDAQVLGYEVLLDVLKESVRSGVDIVQLRDKFGSARDILRFCAQVRRVAGSKALFIVNDRVDLALLAEADGVHIGQDDILLQDVRRMMGKKALIGVSCQSLAQALRARADGADYIGFGSVFKTKTKPERRAMDLKLLRRVWQKMDIPVFPIGGISRRNLCHLTELGINRAAVCRDILLAKRPGLVVKDLKYVLTGVREKYKM